MTAVSDPVLQEDTPQGRRLREYASLPKVAATRHLSAAAYIDEDFSRIGMVDVYHQRRRLVAPAHGYHLPTVLHHCRRARSAYIWRDACLIGSLGFATLSVVGIPAVLVVVALLVCIRQAREAGGDIREVAQAIRAAAGRVTTLLRRMARSVAVSVLGFLSLGACLLLLFSPALTSLLTVLPIGRSAELLQIGIRAVTALLAVGVVATIAGTRLWCQRQMDRLTPDRLRQPPPLRNRRLDEVADQLRGNVTVYANGDPFVGSGHKLVSWGMPIRLVKAGSVQLVPGGPAGELILSGKGIEFQEPPFKAYELVEHVQQRLRRLLGSTEGSEEFAVESQTFLEAGQTEDLATQLADHEVHQVIHDPTALARHYLACRATSRHGELVTHVYLALRMDKSSLYTELIAYALMPIDDRYRVVDQLDGTGKAAQVRACWRGLISAPETAARAPARLASTLLDSMLATVERLPRPRRQRYRRGAELSLRELAAKPVDGVPPFYFSDIRKNIRTIELHSIAVIGEFLSAKGVDTAEFSQRTITIVNQGILNTGTLTAEGAVVAGQNNQVNPTAGAAA